MLKILNSFLSRLAILNILNILTKRIKRRDEIGKIFNIKSNGMDATKSIQFFFKNSFFEPVDILSLMKNSLSNKIQTKTS